MWQIRSEASTTCDRSRASLIQLSFTSTSLPSLAVWGMTHCTDDSCCSSLPLVAETVQVWWIRHPVLALCTLCSHNMSAAAETLALWPTEVGGVCQSLSVDKYRSLRRRTSKNLGIRWREALISPEWSSDRKLRRRIVIPTPPLGAIHYDLCFPWARRARAEQVRQYRLRCQMAYVQSIGGGWASVKNATEALRCTLELYALAGELGDDATRRKCRVFAAWALVWHYDATKGVASQTSSTAEPPASAAVSPLDAAAAIFHHLLRDNEHADDTANWNRCIAALRLWSHMYKREHVVDDSFCVHQSKVPQHAAHHVQAAIAEAEAAQQTSRHHGSRSLEETTACVTPLQSTASALRCNDVDVLVHWRNVFV